MAKKLLSTCLLVAISLLFSLACVTDENSSVKGGSGDVVLDTAAPVLNTYLEDEKILNVSYPTSNSGIGVTGSGTVAIDPDLAIMKIGIEAFNGTVSDARTAAAKAMESVRSTLLANGVQKKDIQTRRFNIYPRYDYEETIVNGRHISKQVLAGYVVSNSANVKLRDLERIGQIVDDTAVSGGDLLRIEGISFTVEDTKPYMSRLRQRAVEDALSKAEEYASYSGVELGSIVALMEGGPPSLGSNSDMGYEMMRSMSAPTSTPIDTGELELNLFVQIVFSIK